MTRFAVSSEQEGTIVVTIRTDAHTGKDGTLSLTVPTQLRDAAVDITMTLIPKERGFPGDYPAGFVEATYGSIKDLDRLPQGEPESRDSWSC